MIYLILLGMDFMSKKIWVTGASGYLGAHIVRRLSSIETYDVLAIGGRNNSLLISGDLTDQSFICRLLSTYGAPDVIIHCAGNKNVTALEANYHLARRDNSEMTTKLFSLMPTSTHFLFLSSDYVFDGHKGNYSEVDRPSPDTLYGFSKYLAERYLYRFDNVAIVRTAAVFDMDATFPNMLLNKWNEGSIVNCFSDMYYSPVYLKLFLDGIEKIAIDNMTGIFHLGGVRTSRYEFACELAKVVHVSQSLIQADYRFDNNEHNDLSLDSFATWSLFGIKHPSLDSCFQHMWSAK
jgi:dTDP-4-dehydrorhamnose reductase